MTNRGTERQLPVPQLEGLSLSLYTLRIFYVNLFDCTTRCAREASAENFDSFFAAIWIVKESLWFRVSRWPRHTPISDQHATGLGVAGKERFLLLRNLTKSRVGKWFIVRLFWENEALFVTKYLCNIEFLFWMNSKASMISSITANVNKLNGLRRSNWIHVLDYK